MCKWDRWHKTDPGRRNTSGSKGLVRAHVSSVCGGAGGESSGFPLCSWVSVIRRLLIITQSRESGGGSASAFLILGSTGTNQRLHNVTQFGFRLSSASKFVFFARFPGAIASHLPRCWQTLAGSAWPLCCGRPSTRAVCWSTRIGSRWPGLLLAHWCTRFSGVTVSGHLVLPGLCVYRHMLCCGSVQTLCWLWSVSQPRVS